jgi:hypothetical protein
MMQYKNSLRTDAIANNTYKEITSQAEATAFLADLLAHHLRNELMSA